MAVLRDRARQAGVSVRSSFSPSALLLLPCCPEPLLRLSQCPLRVCPELDDYQQHCGPLRLGLAGQHQRSNASLAIQLSHAWLHTRRPPGGPSTPPFLSHSHRVCVDDLVLVHPPQIRAWPPALRPKST